jgi:hypothetical protein
MARNKIKNLMAKTGMGMGALLFLLLPLLASATEYTPLATIKRGLMYPTDMAMSPTDSTIYVVDGVSNRVLKYDRGYGYKGAVTSIEYPVAVAASSTGTVYVAENKTKSVKIIDSATGRVTGSLMKGNNVATFDLPQNIEVGPDNSVYVIDQLGDSIEIFNDAGSHTGTISGLVKPLDAVASDSKLFIIDQPLLQDGTYTLTGSRIQVYDLEAGAFTTDHAFPSYGNNTDIGEYISLRGIGIDSRGYIYVSDSFLQVVYTYSPHIPADGTDPEVPLGTYAGPINDGFRTPLGLSVSFDGQLLVTSSFEGAVRVLGVDSAAGIGTWLNGTPVAVAVADQEVEENATFTLDGSGSSDSDGGTITSYVWTQVKGVPVDGMPLVTDSPTVEITAPNVGPEGSVLGFQLVVEDNYSKPSNADTAEVAVMNVLSGSVMINGGALYTNSQVVTLSLDAPEAAQMQFANDSEPFSGDYHVYTTSGTWTLSEYDPAVEVNEKTVNVKFTDAGGNTTVASSSILLDMLAPAPPAIETGGAPGEFNWAPVEGAVSYTLQYASNLDFAGAVTIAGLEFNGLTEALEGLEAGTWYWRVLAVDQAGNASAWSDVGTFAIAPDCSVGPETPQLALPFNGATNIPRTAILETSSMTYPADCGSHLRTEWQVSTAADFSSLVMHVGSTMDNLTVYQIPPLVLEPETLYFWRVRQVASNSTQSGWSETWSFTTSSVSDVQGVDGVLYMNPDGGTPDAGDEEISIKEEVGDAGIKIKAIRVSSGVVAQTVKELDPDTISDSVNKPDSFPLGLLSFRLTVEPGAFAQVEVSFSGAVPDDADWYIYNVTEGWHPYAGAIFSRNRRSVTLNFQDGGIGDADGVANGIIVNP